MRASVDSGGSALPQHSQEGRSSSIHNLLAINPYVKLRCAPLLARPLERHVMRHDLVAATGGGACAHHAAFRFVTVPFPPVQATYKFFDSKTQLDHV